MTETTTPTLAERLENAAGLPIWSVLDAETPEQVHEMVRAAVAVVLRTLADDADQRCAEFNAHELRVEAADVESRS